MLSAPSTPIARDDEFNIQEDEILDGNLFADNGSGADSDPDSDSIRIIAVEGSAQNVGSQITLASGAILTVSLNGAFTYDANGAFDDLNDGETATDTFIYQVVDITDWPIPERRQSLSQASARRLNHRWSLPSNRQWSHRLNYLWSRQLSHRSNRP